jgi:endonuclease YncB( thermonuclease family)
MSKIIVILGFLSLMSCSTVSQQNRSSDVKPGLSDNCAHSPTAFHCVKVVEVYDGDTIFIDLPGQHPLFGKRMGVRIIGIDTPEIRTKNSCEKQKAQKAKKILEQVITNASRVDVVDVQKDKFFRILGTVLADGKPVKDVLIKESLGFPYHGEKKIKRNWCD